jgi:hypothetical protein
MILKESDIIWGKEHVRNMVKRTAQNAVIKCPVCRKNKGEMVPQFGLVACKPCRLKEKALSERTYEVIPTHIKDERQQYKAQTIQPFRNGQLSKEYVSLYGTKYIDATPEEVKNAKNVWGRDLSYYK